MPSSILVVEDEPAIAELIAVNMQHAGHYPIRAYNAEQALSLMSDVLPDLVLLDWMLPGKSGVMFAKELRANERTRQIPISMLTARSEEQDKIMGLDSGADDYVTKPFSATNVEAENPIKLDLGPTEFRLLHFLMTHPERVHSRSQLLDQVWGDHVFVEERTVDVHIKTPACSARSGRLQQHDRNRAGQRLSPRAQSGAVTQ